MKTKIVIIILFCLIVGIFVSGCTSSIKNASAAGTYKSQDNTRTLVLNPDGTFLLPNEPDEYLRSGTYDISDSGDARYQTLLLCHHPTYDSVGRAGQFCGGGAAMLEIAGNKIYGVGGVKYFPNKYNWIKES